MKEVVDGFFYYIEKWKFAGKEVLSRSFSAENLLDKKLNDGNLILAVYEKASHPGWMF